MNNKTKDLEWFEKEMEKDRISIQNHKMKMIEELKSLNRDELFIPLKTKKKTNFFTKIINILGYGKKER